MVALRDLDLTALETVAYPLRGGEQERVGWTLRRTWTIPGAAVAQDSRSES